MFDKIDEDIRSTVGDIDQFRASKNPALRNPEQAGGVRVTRKMVLDASLLCDSLDQVTTLMLRERKIAFFDDNIEDKDKEGDFFRLVELCNLECLLASHNLIKDAGGIFQITTLVELNLSFNLLTDITGIEELTQLRALFLNHNKLSSIDPVGALLNLKQLSLFHNDIMDGPHVASILVPLEKLRELSIDGNPCARDAGFGYELILRMPQLRMVNDEAVKDLDRDVAE